MSPLSRLESRFGRYAVPNLTMILIAGQVLLYLAAQLNPGHGGLDLLEKIRLNPAKVLSGEWWRLVTFLFDPPPMNALFAFFYWYLFHLMGTALEANWGTFRYNLFLAIGYAASVATAFILYFTIGPFNLSVTNAFLYGTIFLAFARLYPDFEINLFFVLPIKIKWLAMIQWFFYAFNFLFGPWEVRAMIAASVLNFFLFFGGEIWRGMKHGHRRMQHQARTLHTPQRIIHRCRVCGLTSDDAPQTQFRYCSKCEDESCYCTEHLRSHEHVATQTGGLGRRKEA
jgi:hypothetical protein